MENLAVVVVPIPGDTLILVLIMIIALTILACYFTLKFARHRKLRTMKRDVEASEISNDGLAANTYSKHSANKTGQILVDSEKIIIEDNQKNIVHRLKRSDVRNVNYIDKVGTS